MTFSADECTYYTDETTSTNNCDNWVTSYTIPKDASYSSHVTTVTVNNGTKDLVKG